LELKIQGGIGNQLFQYALLVSLKTTCLKSSVNLEFYYGVMRTPREAIRLYLLLGFKTFTNSIAPNFFSKLYKKLRKTKLHYIAYILNERFGNVITEVQQFGFRKMLMKRNLDGVVLDGYFADYRYLKNGLEEVKIAFEKLTNKVEISYDQHIAIHIRRGDYTKIMRTEEKSNVLDINYYRRCLDQINNKDLILRIYTDDYEWAKSELPVILEGYRFDFSTEELTDIDSLWTMSKHDFLIGANSTFSLWAYYFGMNKMNSFYFPQEWALSIQKKGYELFKPNLLNINLVNEE
jgi:hypothetical protein